MTPRPSSRNKNHPTRVRLGSLPGGTPLAPLAPVARLTSLAVVLLAASPALPTDAWAQTARSATVAQREYRISAGTLDSVLGQFGTQSNVMVVIDPALTEGKTSPGLTGAHSVDVGLTRLLAGSGLEAVPDNGAYRLRRLPAVAPGGPGIATLGQVTVTGTTERDALPPVAAGGQVATGGRIGVLGNRDLMDTPFSTMNYTAELIENQQARSIVDVLDNDASVFTGWPRESYVDIPQIRGFNVPMTNATFNGLYGVSPISKTPVETLERVELLKGTSAFLRGMSPGGFIGGGVNLVPKRATDTPITRFTATYDSDSQFGGHVDLGRRFGADQQFGVRVNGIYRDGEGALDDSKRTLGTAAIGLDYRSSGVRLSADLGYDRLKVTRGAWWYFLGSAVPAAPDATLNTTQHWNAVTSTTRYGMVRGKVDLNANLTAYAAVGGSDSELDALSPEPSIINAQGDYIEYFGYRPQRNLTKSGEAGVRASFDTGGLKHELTVAGTGLFQKSYFANEFKGTGASNIYRPVFYPKPAFTTDRDNLPNHTRTSLTSLVLADTVSMLDGRLQVMGGLRHQRVDVTGYDESTTTPGLGIVVKPRHDVSVYANYMEALTQGPTAPATASNAGQIFAPYKSKQYEAGVKVDFGSFFSTLSVFQIARPNGQTDAATRRYDLDGEQRNRGLELSVFGEPAKGFRVLAGAMLLDSELTSTAGGVNNGKRGSGTSRTNLKLGGEWDVAAVPGATLTSRVNYSSSQFADAANTRSIPAWATLDLGLRYVLRLSDAQPIVLRANVYNVFDKQYWASASGGWLNVGTPRTIMLSAQFDF
ncbi:TonB-dependent receptor [Pigmentiphaga aceris]|uniref:TonB-dependent receptor n=1 Tax=Pigmentiphaga aceris TaxID=1940612 RepID=A0A5C0AYI6_9BURK|nr:TonB-dependent receptor [Pigmentiphaga aceris]QEI07512.1 TonB-dependent receptor [Pigmentiphaga aceris]